MPAALGLLGASVLGAILVFAFDLALGRRYRTVQFVLAGSLLLTVLLLPFFQFAQSELAPKEDQGVVFSILAPSPTATIEQNSIYAREVQKIYESVPEYDASFQVTSANFGISGMILKPWSERRRTSVAIGDSLQAPAAAVAGVNVIVPVALS